MRRFTDDLIKRGEARNFLIAGGFMTPTGKLPKRYGGWGCGAHPKRNSPSQPGSKND